MLGWMLTALGVLFGLGLAIIVMFTNFSGSLPGALFSALPAIIAIPMVIHDLRYPRINDVATNIKAPLAFVTALHAAENTGRDMSFPEKNGPIIRDHATAWSMQAQMQNAYWSFSNSSIALNKVACNYYVWTVPEY